jgi:hypothetical protein
MKVTTCSLQNVLLIRKEPLSKEEFHVESYLRLSKIDFKGIIYTNESVGKSNLLKIYPGDLIISRINAGRGAISLHQQTKNLAATNHYAIFSIRKEIILPELLIHILQNQELKDLFLLQIRPGIKTEISNRSILKLRISFPSSLEDQISLLESLEHRLHQIHNLKCLVEQFQNGLLNFRKKVLNEYFSESSSLNQSTARVQNPENQDWNYIKLTELAMLRVGKTPSPQYFCKQGVPFLKVQNIINQAVNTEIAAFFTKPEYHKQKFGSFPSKPGDILMNIVGPPLGKIAILPNQVPEAGYNQGLINIRPIQEEMTKWIYWYLTEMSAINCLPRKGIAGQENLSIKQIRNIHVPVPSSNQRVTILNNLEKNFRILEQLESRCKNLSNLLVLLNAKIISYTLSLSNKNG